MKRTFQESEVEKILQKNQIHNIIDSVELSKFNGICKKSWGNTIICRFL